MAQFITVTDGMGNLLPGQKVTLTLQGIVSSDARSIKVETINIGKKAKMSTQEALLRTVNKNLEELKGITPKTETRL